MQQRFQPAQPLRVVHQLHHPVLLVKYCKPTTIQCNKMGVPAGASRNGAEQIQPPVQVPLVHLPMVQLHVHLGKYSELQLHHTRHLAAAEVQVLRRFNVLRRGAKLTRLNVLAKRVQLQQRRVVLVILHNQAEHIPITRQDVELLRLRGFSVQVLLALLQVQMFQLRA